MNVLGIRLNDDEEALVNQAAQLELQPGDRGGSTSWARRVLIREAKKVVDEAAPPLDGGL